MTEQGADQDRILIVDDSKDVALPLKLYFEQRGAQVSIARTMDEGLDAASQHRPDIILLAATLGGVDGVEIFRKLRRTPLTAHIPVMFIADFRDAMRQNQLLAEGADDVIIQPFDVEILALRIRNAIQRTRREGLTDSITGLPGAALIAERRAEMAGQPDQCELTVSLANFDFFRARYDFITGNEVLRYVAGALLEAALEGDFVGCQGEGSFLVITTTDRAAPLTDTVKGTVDEGLLNFYTFMEREQGFVQIEDGRGGYDERPLMHATITRADP